MKYYDLTTKVETLCTNSSTTAYTYSGEDADDARKTKIRIVDGVVMTYCEITYIHDAIIDMRNPSVLNRFRDKIINNYQDEYRQSFDILVDMRVINGGKTIAMYYSFTPRYRGIFESVLDVGQWIDSGFANPIPYLKRYYTSSSSSRQK